MMKFRAAQLILLLALAGCDATDPYQRTGVWRPNNANAINLRAMVLVPSDLALATPASPDDGGLAAAAVLRLRHDNVKTLPDSGVLQVAPVASGAAPPIAPPQAAAPATAASE
jgi:hypothetical protein